MKILIIEEASVEYHAEFVDVSTFIATKHTPRATVGTLTVRFHTISDDTMHASVSDVILALQRCIDRQPPQPHDPTNPTE